MCRPDCEPEGERRLRLCEKLASPPARIASAIVTPCVSTGGEAAALGSSSFQLNEFGKKSGVEGKGNLPRKSRQGIRGEQVARLNAADWRRTACFVV